MKRRKELDGLRVLPWFVSGFIIDENLAAGLENGLKN